MTTEEAYKYLKSTSPYIECGNCEHDCVSCLFPRAYDMAVKALEKQIPKKPIKRHGLYLCPKCKTTNVDINDCTFEIKFNFCDCCGQAIDWSDEE